MSHFIQLHCEDISVATLLARVARQSLIKNKVICKCVPNGTVFPKQSTAFAQDPQGIGCHLGQKLRVDCIAQLHCMAFMGINQISLDLVQSLSAEIETKGLNEWLNGSTSEQEPHLVQPAYCFLLSSSRIVYCPSLLSNDLRQTVQHTHRPTVELWEVVGECNLHLKALTAGLVSFGNSRSAQFLSKNTFLQKSRERE